MEIYRGNTKTIRFRRRSKNGNNFEPILKKAKKVYFTVKRYENDRKALIQKTIDDMIFDKDSGYYSLTFFPEDTENMSFGNYVYDILVIDEKYKKTVSKNVFTIVGNVTHKGNEV